MLPGGTHRLPYSLVYDGGPRSEYIALVRRQLRTRKVSLVENTAWPAGSLPSPSGALPSSVRYGMEVVGNQHLPANTRQGPFPLLGSCPSRL